MKAFTGIMSKEELLNELKEHQRLDNFVQGQYFENGKGCFIGCSLESLGRKKGIRVDHSDHLAYEAYFELPEWFARLQDRIFEGLSIEEAKKWSVRCTEAINVGSDLNKIKNSFLIKVIESTFNDYNKEKYSDVYKAQMQVIKSLKGNGDLEMARLDADAAAASVADAAASAASAAASAADAASARQERYLELSNELVKLVRECK